MGHLWKLKTEEKSVKRDGVNSHTKKVRRGILVYFNNHQVTKPIAPAEPASESPPEGCSKLASGSCERPEDGVTQGIEMVVIVHSGH